MNSGYYKDSTRSPNFQVSLYPKRHFDIFESVTTQLHNIVQKPVKGGINHGLETL